MGTIRTPTQADLPAVIELTRLNRTLLAELEPHFWRKSANADEMHRLFVTFQLGNDGLIKRVLEKDGRVIGYAVSANHPSGFYFVDDVALAPDADWEFDGIELLGSVTERPALMTAPHLDHARVAAARAAGLQRIGTVRSLRFDQSPTLELDAEVRATMPVPHNLASPPTHVWLPAMTTELISVIGDDHGGYVVISAPTAAPPIYDPGGKPSVVDRVIGTDRLWLLRAALTFAQRRGDIGVILIIDENDHELAAIADQLGARHPVDVYRRPG